MFELVRKTELPEYEGVGLFYVHKETGMEVFHIKNSNTELCCNFIVSTPSEDDTGVAHILEHTVLCGSKRFPVKDPYSQASLSSPNTFMNAMTFCDKTMFPVASPLKKDFDNLFDIYSDAVFSPLLREESFWQEGIRSFGGKFDGVVFNEMCGARSTEDSVVQNWMVKDLMRGTPYEFDSGGDPASIVDLTYEQYLERYHRWYTPTNIKLFLFGDMETQEYLDKIEHRYLKDCPRGQAYIPNVADVVSRSAHSVRTNVTCPAKDASSVVLTWLTTPSNDPFQVLVVSILVDILLGNPGAPLYKAIIESDLGEDLNPMCGTDPESPILPFTVGFSGAVPNREDEIEQFLIGLMRKYVNEGLPEDAVAAAIKRQEFKLQEVPSDGVPYGILASLRAARTWLKGKKPEDGIVNKERLARLKDEISRGRFFESWIEKYILNNPSRCLLSVSSDPKTDKVLQNNLKAKCKKIVHSKEEEQRFTDFINMEDSEEAVSTIGRITRADLPERIPTYNQSVEYIAEHGIISNLPVFTNGIVYINMAFDFSFLSLEDLKLLPLLIRLMQMCGTKTMDYTQVGTRIRTLTGSFNIFISSNCTVTGKKVSKIIVRTKTLQEDYEKGLDLVREILLDGILTDKERIKAALIDLTTDFESEFIDCANAFAVMHASSQYAADAFESENTSGISCWMFLDDLKKKTLGDAAILDGIASRLVELRDSIFVRNEVVFHSACDSDFVEKANSGGLSLISLFPVRDDKVPVVRTIDTVSGEKRKVFTVSSGPAFNSLVFRFDRGDERNVVRMGLLSYMLSNGYLWNEIRGKNGAYGVESHVDMADALFAFSSYRDPNIEETLRIFINSLETDLREEEIEYSIVTSIGKEIKPMAPRTKAFEGFRRILYGMTDSLYLERRRALLEMNLEDLKDAGRTLAGLIHDRTVSIVCGKEMAEKAGFVDYIDLPI